MTRLVLVRHGRPAASWTEDPDPGLDPEGHEQARRMAEALADHGPLPVVTSPLRRTRETAAALEALWGQEALVDARVGEIPSPDLDVAQRGAWLLELMQGRWGSLAPDLCAWRDSVVETLSSFESDAIIVTHFVAINAAVGAANGDDRVMCFQPAHCSRTTIEVTPSGLRLVALGAEAETTVR